MKPPVIEQVVENNLCIGCGCCAAICPQNLLKIKWNHYGEYNAVSDSSCEKECGLCLKVCPFTNIKENEDTIGRMLYGKIPNIKHSSETGYYLESYVGYSDEHRQNGASGGMSTWLLEMLLTNAIVDHVICVAPNNDPNKLFDFKIFNTIEELRNGAGSAYYPVEMSEVIRFILSTPGKFAITGLPCFIKAIRLAQQNNIKIRERIIVTIGLTCGQLKSKFYTHYLSTLAGVDGTISNVHYRGKEPDKPANKFYFSCRNEKGDYGRIFWNDGVSEAWVNRWFTPNACNFCDDIFSECADIDFMDAWLTKYLSDYRGTSLMLVRSSRIYELIEGARKNSKIYCEQIPIQELILSQSGVTSIKRNDLMVRLFLAQQCKVYTPKKRISQKCSASIKLLKRLEIETLNRMQDDSRTLYMTYLNKGTSIKIVYFKKKLKPYLRKLKLIRRISRVLKFPTSIFNAIRNKKKVLRL